MRWTLEEKDILRRLYGRTDVSREDLLRVFPYRNWLAIQSEAKNLGLKRDSGERGIDRAFLKRLLEVVEG